MAAASSASATTSFSTPLLPIREHPFGEMSGLMKLWDAFVSLVDDSTSNDYLNHSGSRRGLRFLLVLLCSLFFLSDISSGSAWWVLLFDLSLTLTSFAIQWMPRDSLVYDASATTLMSSMYITWMTVASYHYLGFDTTSSVVVANYEFWAFGFFFPFAGINFCGASLYFLIWALGTIFYTNVNVGVILSGLVFGIGCCVSVEYCAAETVARIKGVDVLLRDASAGACAVDLRSGLLCQVSQPMEALFGSACTIGEPFLGLVHPTCRQDFAPILARGRQSTRAMWTQCKHPTTKKIFDCKVIWYRRSATKAWLCLQVFGEMRDDVDEWWSFEREPPVQFRQQTAGQSNDELEDPESKLYEYSGSLQSRRHELMPGISVPEISDSSAFGDSLQYSMSTISEDNEPSSSIRSVSQNASLQTRTESCFMASQEARMDTFPVPSVLHSKSSPERSSLLSERVGQPNYTDKRFSDEEHEGRVGFSSQKRDISVCPRHHESQSSRVQFVVRDDPVTTESSESSLCSEYSTYSVYQQRKAAASSNQPALQSQETQTDPFFTPPMATPGQPPKDRPPKIPVNYKVSFCTRRCLQRKFKETCSSTVLLLVRQLQAKLNPRAKGCCAWHVTLVVLSRCIREALTKKCDGNFALNTDWQCQLCSVINEDCEDLEERECAFCGMPPDYGQVDIAPDRESLSEHSSREGDASNDA